MNNYLKEHINQILSYLNAKNDNYNNVITIPSKDRNISNGFAQFILQANLPLSSKLYSATKFNLRVEMNVWNNNLAIKCNKANFIENANMLVFGNKDENVIYISTELDWLNNTKYYTNGFINSYLGSFTVRNYSIPLLMKDEKIVMLQNEATQLFSATGSLHNINIDDTQKCDIYGYAEKSCSDIEYVQNDRKTGKAVWYAFYNERYTNNASTIKGISEYINKLFPTLKVDYIQRYLYRAMKDNKSEISIKVDEKQKDCLISSLRVEPNFFDGNKIVVKLSENKGTDTWKIYEDAKNKTYAEWNETYKMSKATYTRYRKFPLI